MALATFLLARGVAAAAPDASALLDPANARLLDALTGRGGRLSPRFPAHAPVSITRDELARLDRAGLASLRQRYPGTTFEAAGPLHTLLDRAAVAVAHPRTRGLAAPTGRGVVVAVADTGFDLAHADLRRADGGTRARWVLDLTQAPRGVYGDLEARFGVRDSAGNLQRGAVFDAAMVDDALTSGRSPIDDDEGHGTHVTSLAAGSPPTGAFVGIAPAADLVLVRLAGGAFPDITADAIEKAAAFAFDRAAALQEPCVLNLSVGTDFGPHDGTPAWENSLAAHVADDAPGHAIVVAAGNSGRPSDRVHQSVALSSRTVAVPFRFAGATEGTVRVWVTAVPGSTLRIGVRTGDAATTVSPLGRGFTKVVNGAKLSVAVLHGANAIETIPRESSSAVVLIDGTWGTATPELLVEGEGRVELWFDAAAFRGQGAVGFLHGVREGTVDEPAVHPALLAVGCTVSRPSWTGASGLGPFAFPRPRLDAAGGEALTPLRYVSHVDGEACDFSGAGPSATGVPKPDLAAPGLAIAGAMSAMATPGTVGSMFSATCSAPGGVLDSRCLQADRTHGFAFGTSMSAPLVAGAVALLLEGDPSLTQRRVRALLQGSTHRLRAGETEGIVAGAGELDVRAALALQAQGAASCEVASASSFVVASRAYVPATGTDGVRVRVQPRCADGLAARIDLAALHVVATLESGAGVPVTSAGDGEFTLPVLAGQAGQRVAVRVTYEGKSLGADITLPVGAGPWDARYGLALAPSCGYAPASATRRAAWATLLLPLIVAVRRRRKKL